MKQPKTIKEEHTKCASCGKPIHISELAMIGKMGMYHSNALCLLDGLKQNEKALTQNKEGANK